MKLRKIIWIPLLLLCAVIGGGIALLATGKVAAAADNFFETYATQGPNAAYALTAPAFKQSATLDMLARVAQSRHLDHFKSASWPHREITGGMAKLTGTVTIADGTTRPATVGLVKDQDSVWRVIYFDLPAVGVAGISPGISPDVAASGSRPTAAASSIAQAAPNTPANAVAMRATPATPVSPSASAPGSATSATTSATTSADPRFAAVRAWLHQPALLNQQQVVLDRGADQILAPCGDRHFRSTGLLFVQPPVFSRADGVSAGVFRETWSAEGCAAPHVDMNLWTVAKAGQPPAFFLSFPGGSLADPTLQKSALPLALADAASLTPSACHAMKVVNTDFEHFDGPPRPTVGGELTKPWTESWKMAGCGHLVQVEMRFTPDATGTNALASKRDSWVLR